MDKDNSQDGEILLLLTGTVNPRGMAFTKLLDVETRKNQYIDSLKFWVRTAGIPVIFVENSNFDLSDFFKEEIASGKLEIMQFEGNDYSRQLGKGYGELLCLEHAYQQNERIRNASFIFKATGRHRVLNFQSFYQQYVDNKEVEILVDFFRFLEFCDSRFFGFKPFFIPEYLLKYKEMVDDSKWIFFENILAKATLQAVINYCVFRPLKHFPRIKGSSATLGITYNSSYLYWLKNNMVHRMKYFSFKSFK